MPPSSSMKKLPYRIKQVQRSGMDGNTSLRTKKTGGRMPPVLFTYEAMNYFIIAAATFLNALTSASMCSSVYVGWVQKEIVESAREFAISQLNLV